MHIILLSGGSGKRLWPLSNDTMSKQFLRLLTDENGNKESMVQRVYRQLSGVGLSSSVTIATGSMQLDSIRKQLGQQVDVVLEPERRNTYPAIILSLAYLYFKKNAKIDDSVVVIPVDPYTEDSFFEKLIDMDNLVKKDTYDMVLMGIKPTYPSEKYGYIMVNEDNDSFYTVKEFKEKPDLKTAEKYLTQGAYWNGGVFAFKIGFLLNDILSKLGINSYDEMLDRYGELAKNSIDYEVVEKTKSIAMVTYEGYWKDLGTWNTLTEEMASETVGNVLLGEDTANTSVINVTEQPIITLGIKNAVVVASAEGILVSDKQKSSYLKPYAEEVENRPMFEQKRWGEYKVLDYVTYEDNHKSLTKHLTMDEGQSISYQVHKHRDEVWTIVDGVGLILLEGKTHEVKPGDTISISAGTRHALKALSKLHFIEVQLGSELEEEDIERFDWEWE